MAVKLNSEFNYRYQVQGETIWEKIKTLKSFLEGRIRAACLEDVAKKKFEAKKSEIAYYRATGPEFKAIVAEAELLELESHLPAQVEAFNLNREEIQLLEKLIAEAYAIAEPTRIQGYSDEQMFEANSANEFTSMIAKDIQAELIACGRPSATKIRNAMSNPITWNALIAAGLIPSGNEIIQCSNDPKDVVLLLPDKETK